MDDSVTSYTDAAGTPCDKCDLCIELPDSLSVVVSGATGDNEAVNGSFAVTRVDGGGPGWLGGDITGGWGELWQSVTCSSSGASISLQVGSHQRGVQDVWCPEGCGCFVDGSATDMTGTEDYTKTPNENGCYKTDDYPNPYTGEYDCKINGCNRGVVVGGSAGAGARSVSLSGNNGDGTNFYITVSW